MQRQLEELNLLFQYLTGPRFRKRIEAIVEKFSFMQTDLERERKTMMRLRARREGQLRGMIKSTVGMYGDLQGIAGKALEKIDGLAQIARRVEARQETRSRKPPSGTHQCSRPHSLIRQFNLIRRKSTKKKGRGRVIKSTRSEVGRRGLLANATNNVHLERTSRRSSGRRDHRHLTGHQLRRDLL